MRRFIASIAAVVSLAAAPALAFANPATKDHGDCAKKCDCTGKVKNSAAVPSQEPSDWVKSIWSGA